METPASSLVSGTGRAEKPVAGGFHELVDPFIVEALGNPRHRVTVLRMELDIQRFMQNSDQHQFEYEHFPTSYLRCAAHRVAQYYGLQTTTLENTGDVCGRRILAVKTPDSRFPPVRLSDIPTKQPENVKSEQVKIAIHQRSKRASSIDSNRPVVRCSSSRTVEEREEEYEKARARIFNDSGSPDVGGLSLQASPDVIKPCFKGDEDCSWIPAQDVNVVAVKDGANRVSIIRDREKDLNDPDYCRNYDRYAKALMPAQGFNPEITNGLMPPFFHYQGGIPQLPQFPIAQTPMSYGPSNPSLNPFCAFVRDKPPTDAVYFQWPNPTMVYANSCEQMAFQVPFRQPPLSFEHSHYF